MHPFQIVGQGDQFPFAGCRLQAVQRELPEAHDLFDANTGSTVHLRLP